MNAHALLTSQGWLGTGHALDSRLTDYGAPTYKQKGHRGLAYDPATTANNASANITAGNGLAKPLLVSQRHRTRYGIGKKAHEPQSGNEWWLKGFSAALENIGKSESERSSVVDSGTSTPRNGVGNVYTGKHSGLYGYFTTGRMMKGSLEEESETQGTKRKSDVLEDAEEKQDPLAVSPVKRVQTAKELETSIPYFEERDKNRKKKHVRVQSTHVEQFAAVGQFLGVAEIGKKGRTKEESKYTSKIDGETREESKEERRARRRRRKADKSTAGKSLAQMVEEELAKLTSEENSHVDLDSQEASDTEISVSKAVRKERRRKE